MTGIKMDEIKPKILRKLEDAGYKFVQQQCYEKWIKGRNDCVWFSKQVARATKGNEGSLIIQSIAGQMNGSVSENQQGKFDSWYTDGYKGRGTAAI